MISGTVFRDSNRNGAWNSGEPGLAGGHVFRDLDRDGVWGGNEYNRLTDSAGNYSLERAGWLVLPPGRAPVRLDV